VHDILKAPERNFVARYAALRAVRFFWDERPALVTRGELLAAMERLLGQADIADLAVEDLRRWGRWEVAGRILTLHEKEAFWQYKTIRRAVLRYALCCPLPEAASFMQEMRQLDAEMVKEIEEMLKAERESSPKPAPASS
jgi:hypothetical protein